MQFQGVEIGPGGLFPLAPQAKADLRVDARENPDGSLLLLLLIRVTALPQAGRPDEREPGQTLWGTLPPDGGVFRGSLLAKSDRDDVDVTVTRSARFDLSLTVQDHGDADLRLLWVDCDGHHPLLNAAAVQGTALRRALTLTPGDYRLEISGERAAPSDYTLTLRPATPGGPEGEPDDQSFAARDMAPGTALRGQLAEDDPAYIAFTVPVADHLWELRGVQGLTDLALTDGNDRDVGAWRARNGALVACGWC